MVTKRNDDDFKRGMDDTPVAMEALRASAVPGESAKGDEKMSLFWRVFGGAIISVVALVALTLFNYVMSTVNELRAEVVKLNEAKAEAAKKDDVAALRTQVAAQAEYRRDIDSLKERASKHRTEIDDARREIQTKFDAVQKEVSSLEVLKDRLSTAATDLKGLRDDVTKLRTDVDKNQSQDHERRDRRDEQMKQIDAAMKDLQKTMTETREKIARLEGQQAKPAEPPAKPKPTSGPKTATPTRGADGQ